MKVTRRTTLPPEGPSALPPVASPDFQELVPDPSQPSPSLDGDGGSREGSPPGGGRVPPPNSLYRPEYIPQVLALFNRGMSLTEVAREIMVRVDTVRAWRRSHPEFNAAVKAGLDLSQAWWEKQGREHIYDRHFNATLWMMNMTNRHGWKTNRDEKGGRAIESPANEPREKGPVDLGSLSLEELTALRRIALLKQAG